jgi:hypothetical protein
MGADLQRHRDHAYRPYRKPQGQSQARFVNDPGRTRRVVYQGRARHQAYPPMRAHCRSFQKQLTSLNPATFIAARRLVEGYVEHYNNIRLNSAVGYITRRDVLAGRQAEIHAERDRKLEEARKQRQIRRQQAA